MGLIIFPSETNQQCSSLFISEKSTSSRKVKYSGLEGLNAFITSTLEKCKTVG